MNTGPSLLILLAAFIVCAEVAAFAIRRAMR